MQVLRFAQNGKTKKEMQRQEQVPMQVLHYVQNGKTRKSPGGGPGFAWWCFVWWFFVWWCLFGDG
jgi:hypothetical protein